VGARFDELMEQFIDGLVVNPYATAATGRSVLQAVMPPPQSSTSPAAPSDTLLLRFQQEAGVPFLAGTDVLGNWPLIGKQVSGFALHAELAMDVAEGLAPLAVLQSATLNPAKFLHATDSLGTVAPGKLADLVLLDADPLADITNTTTIRAVVANGRYFDRAALDGLLREVQAKAKQNP
jgi:imidazolonepropionase-like amidohydrolase